MSDTIQAVGPLSEIREHAGAVREFAAVERERNGIIRDGLKTVRDLPGVCGTEARSTVTVVGQEARDTGTHLAVVGGGWIVVVVFIIKLIFWLFSKR